MDATTSPYARCPVDLSVAFHQPSGPSVVPNAVDHISYESQARRVSLWRGRGAGSGKSRAPVDPGISCCPKYPTAFAPFGGVPLPSLRR